LYELRWRQAPPLTGSQSLSVLIAESSMPRDQYNRLLRELVERLDAKEAKPGNGHRLMVSGSVIDNPAMLGIIEDTGGLVVSDMLCFGATRSFGSPMAEDGDPLDAIAERYYSQILCPRMFDSYPERLQTALELAKDAQVDGVILQSILNCDLHGIDNVMLQRDFEKAGFPVLVLEREYDALADVGRLKTRVQAFLERLGA
jgi:benzoyl-CoA reductase/2-hydroxyglutaryl-CoA dehydratase subunit BcrC/BadD/HgdB